jgi:hypothetical protein
MRMVKNHSFHAQGQSSEEHLDLDRGFAVDIEQSGCEKLRQTFKFSLAGGYADLSDDWGDEAANLLYQLGGIDPSIRLFDDWSSAIGLKKDKVKLGEELALDPSHAVRVDRIKTDGGVMVTVDLIEK